MGTLEKKSMAGRLLLFLLTVSAATADEDVLIGVNIGTDLSDMPHPTQVVTLLKAQQIRHVRLYDADRATLVALANTGIKVMIFVPNEQILGIGQSNATAANWGSRNVVTLYPATNITAIAVGSETQCHLFTNSKLLAAATTLLRSDAPPTKPASSLSPSPPSTSA